MIKAINQWCFPGKNTVADCLQKAVAAGFRAFEPALDETGELSLETTEKDLLRIRNMARDMDVKLVSLASGLYWKYSLTSDNAATRAKAADIVRKQLDAAALLGVDGILVVPGAVGTGFWGASEFVYYDAAYDRALEAMTTLSAHAQGTGVVIGVENVWNNFLLSPLEMRDFLDKVGSPFVGAYFDVGNVLKQSFPEMWIRILGKRIKKVHVKDFKTSVGTLDGFVDLLGGDVNFPAVVRELAAVGYDGALTAEVFGGGCYPEDSVSRISHALDVILGA